MSSSAFAVRAATASDLDAVMDLYEAVASEGKWIGGEAPIDRDRWRRGFESQFLSPAEPATMLVAEADGGPAVIGNIGIQSHHGVAELGMMVAAGWRGRGVGPKLLEAGVDWTRRAGMHKLTLQVWPHNDSARGLYARFGFVEEGYLRRHWRRRNGQLWDAVLMALVLDESSPGSPFGGV